MDVCVKVQWNTLALGNLKWRISLKESYHYYPHTQAKQDKVISLVSAYIHVCVCVCVCVYKKKKM